MHYFPQIYEQELLFSAFARLHLRIGNISFKATMQDLFGKTTATSIVDLPCNNRALIERMPVGTKLTEEKLIHKYTLFPYYTAFLPPDRKNAIYQSMLSSNGGNIHMRTGIMASSVTSKAFLQFCPVCFLEDKEKYGESYWHREHQLPGYFICTKHMTFLQDSLISLSSKNKHEYVPANMDNCITNDAHTGNKNNGVMLRTISGDMDNNVVKTTLLNYTEDTYMKLLRISQYSENLLKKEHEAKPMGWFSEIYVEKLKFMGLANINGIVRWAKLYEEFINHFGKDFLQLVQSPVDVDSESNWLRMILRKNRKSFHPLRHILLIDFLGLTLDEVFDSKLKYEPFGNGPWLCLNAGAEHYMKPVVRDLKITYGQDNKSPIATFTCDCGFIYKRSGPVSSESDKCQIGRVVQYGKVWEEKLRELVEMGLGLRETARRLKVDANTVKKYAVKLRLQVPWGTLSDNKKQVMVVSDFVKGYQMNYRNEWLRLIEQHPNKTKTELRMAHKALYTWLYRNDKGWLDENSPKIKTMKIVNKRIDWENRDDEILVMVKSEIEKMLSSEKKPERITVSRVGKKIGMLALLEKHLDKLPRTKAYLNLVTESIEDFQARRVRWAIKELIKDGEGLQEWRINRKAGIRKRNYSKSIQIADFK